MERLLLLLDELEDYFFCLPLMWTRLRRALLLGALGIVVAALMLQAPAVTASAALVLPLLMGLLLGTHTLHDPV